jgi:hypothetical protein
MFDIQLNGIIQMYADDTVIKYCASSLDELFDMINVDMTRLKSWFDANLLALNVDKTNFVIFERKGAMFFCLFSMWFGMEMKLCEELIL